MHQHFRPLVAATQLALGTVATATPSFVNGLALNSAALDMSGGLSANTGRIGYFSDLYWDHHRSEWWGLSDRGPGGGTIGYDTRVQRFTLDVNLNTGFISNLQIAATIVFRSGISSLNGLAIAGTTTPGLAFDPEGFVVSPRSGTLLVSDEFGPSVREFSRTGQLIRDQTIQANTVPRAVAPNPNSAYYAINHNNNGILNTAGRRTNRDVGVGAEFATADKEVFRINLAGATDVTGIDLDAPGAVFTKVAKSAPYAAPVPEPGSWAMLLAGLAAIGGMVKRRRSW